MKHIRSIRILLVSLLLVTAWSSAFSQVTTATLRGKVTNEQGRTLAGAEVNAVATGSGFVHTTKAGADGSFLLGGITPGEYNLVVSATGYEPKTQDVVVRIGQTLDVDLRLSATAVVAESITVVGNQLIDTHTAEASTNVTQQQMENLPQDDRNFLGFATLAPGVSLSTDPTRKVITADAQPAEQTNVFIDGVSFKNDVLDGGVVGQDSSRGSPFPQTAVQEFQVLTQNYKAEHEKASSLVITAVTKSGGNRWSGEGFLFFRRQRDCAE